MLAVLSAGATAAATSGLTYYANGTDTTFTLLIKGAWALISIFLIPGLIKLISNDVVRRACFKGAEAFVRSLAEDALQGVEVKAKFDELLAQFKVEHPAAAHVPENVVKMALQAALNRLTCITPVIGAKDAGRRELIRGM